MTEANRVIRACVGLLLATAAVLGSTSCDGARGTHAQVAATASWRPQAATAPSSYCAIFSDSIGLYVGNPVTQMGYKIGTVKKIKPGATSVQVDFSVTDTRPLPGNVKAVIRSASILADRALELVGNYESGPKLQPGQCVPLARTVTPKSLSEVIDSANRFVKGINPENSTNIGDALKQIDQAMHNTGPGINQILTTSARLLDSPDQSISDLKSIIGNMAKISTTLVQTRGPMKQALNDAVITTPYVQQAAEGSYKFLEPLPLILEAVIDLATHETDDLQLTLDAVSDVLRVVYTPHWLGWISALGGIIKSVPWWINVVANHYNNMPYFSLLYRPPMYRIRLPDGPRVCAMMNASNPGSCANVAGQPYGVDINLLQYVFMNAHR